VSTPETEQLHYEPGRPPRFVRSVHMWRRPTVHILWRTWRTYVNPDLAKLLGQKPGWEYLNTPLCSRDGNNHMREVNIYDALPEGLHVCQRCAEVAAADSRRDAQRERPNWAAYEQRTEDLLGEAAA
jgi:hypothetical protein